MVLSEYHLKYVNMPMANVLHGLKAKKFQLVQAIKKANWQPGSEAVRVAVLGCADRRFVAGHKEMFGKLFSKNVEVTTFDIEAEHLAGEENVIQHDCTKPLPHGPFDFIFSHIILKFMPEHQQWQVLQNSFNALKAGGLAAHFFDVGGETLPTNMLEKGFFKIPLAEFKQKFKHMRVKTESILVEKNGAEKQKYLECLLIYK